MCELGALEQEVYGSFFRVSARWALRALHLFESAEVKVEGDVTCSQLEDGARSSSRYIFVTDIFEVLL